MVGFLREDTSILILYYSVFGEQKKKVYIYVERELYIYPYMVENKSAKPTLPCRLTLVCETICLGNNHSM